jgi:hypothetical protein
MRKPLKWIVLALAVIPAIAWAACEAVGSDACPPCPECPGGACRPGTCRSQR